VCNRRGATKSAPDGLWIASGSIGGNASRGGGGGGEWGKTEGRGHSPPSQSGSGRAQRGHHVQRTRGKDMPLKVCRSLVTLREEAEAEQGDRCNNHGGYMEQPSGKSVWEGETEEVARQENERHEAIERDSRELWRSAWWCRRGVVGSRANTAGSVMGLGHLAPHVRC
jgi:hypothetical protein